MLPHYHAIIAAITVLVVSLIFFPDLTIIESLLWIVVGSIIAAVIDIDAIILANIKSKREPALQRFQSYKAIANDFNAFINTMGETGTLKTVLITHVIFSLIIFLLFYLFLKPYIVPVIFGILTHLLTDIKYIKKI